MLVIFEGARNSGKTYLAQKASDYNKIPLYKFEFVKWFNDLKLKDDSRDSHLFALGKEIQLLQANRDGILQPIILDRGFLTVLVWGVLSKRIDFDEALEELDKIMSAGLLRNCKVYYIHGENPNKSERNKDNWDFRDNTSEEKFLYEKFIQHIVEVYPGRFEEFSIYSFENKFDETSIIKDL
jgi:hypothetical protein